MSMFLWTSIDFFFFFYFRPLLVFPATPLTYIWPGSDDGKQPPLPWCWNCDSSYLSISRMIMLSNKSWIPSLPHNRFFLSKNEVTNEKPIQKSKEIFICVMLCQIAPCCVKKYHRQRVILCQIGLNESWIQNNAKIDYFYRVKNIPCCVKTCHVGSKTSLTHYFVSKRQKILDSFFTD